MSDTKSGWSFNAQNYLSSGLFVKEVMSTAEKLDVTMFERDDRLFCYPALLRVIPTERVVAIDRRRERHLRPSVLVNLLKDLQGSPPRFRSESFLNALFEGYSRIVSGESQRLSGHGSGSAPGGHLRAARLAARSGQGIFQVGICSGHLPFTPE